MERARQLRADAEKILVEAEEGLLTVAQTEKGISHAAERKVR